MGALGSSKITFQWFGGALAADVDRAITEGLEALAERIEGRLHTELHRWPKHEEHLLADEAFATVSNPVTGVHVLSAGSDAPYTIYHELGTSKFIGHPQIRQIMDEEMPRISIEIRTRLPF